VRAVETKLYDSRTRPKQCPACGCHKVALIQYGLPAFDDEMNRQLEAGKIVLGGCCISDCDPKWQCVECGAQVYRTKDLLWRDL
jgi:predicted nucleic-acid-binding Zn-ribbon protein